MLTNEEVAQDIIRQYGEEVYDFDDPYSLLTLTTSRDKIISLLEYLKDHPTFQINFLTDITGIHYPDSPGREFCVVYHAHGLVKNFRIRLKVFFKLKKIDIFQLLQRFMLLPTGWSVKRLTFLALSRRPP